MRYGGRFTLSDDSHGPHAVGLNYSRMRDYILRVGIKDIWILERSVEVNSGDRFTHPRKVGDDIWEDEFWRKATNVSR